MIKKILTSFILLSPTALLAAELNLPDVPLFVDGSKTALVQIVMERDNKLFFEAYPTYEDINNDGVLDIKYKPDEIDYYGYFDSNFCYQAVGGDHMEPVSTTADKTCSGLWSGDFLNYTTMTRMDVMLRALYGGKRVIDTSTETRLRRAFVPWENHTWGIEYTSTSIDGFDIANYAPLSQPSSGKRHLIATNNKDKNDVPWMRVRINSDERIWEWVDKERTQGDGYANLEVPLDVTVCGVSFIEDFCQQYPNGQYKPVGLLHEYGENNSMYFSLISGSFENNLQGGVLRQQMSSFGENEVDPETGEFTRSPGIVTSMDAIQIPNDYTSSTVQRDCGWLWSRTFENGECRAWGNPVAEMMYEGMRYLAGEMTPTPEFETSGGMDETLGLESAAWDDPYSDSKPYAQCSSAYQLVISDPSPSFDGDQLPGSAFASFTGSTLGDLHVGDLADYISSNEDALPGLKFIGEVGSLADGSPSPKMVTTFRNIRGQAPEAPHRQGSYYAPSVAYYGHQNDLHENAPGKQTVGNFTLALGSPLPSIDVDVAGTSISFAPFAKTVDFCGRSGSDFKPTNAIVGFTVEDITDTTGSFRVSFEDMEQGADNDMDAVARYSYSVSGNVVTMEVDSLTASGCAIQHMGYTVSGTTLDGVHLVIRDSDTRENSDPDYELDVPPNAIPGSGWSDGVALPLNSKVEFRPSAAPAAQVLPSPLWYAAKWGGFDDVNEDGIPQKSEWDSNDDGLPDNYFPVTDPSRMVNTMRSVFNQISEQAGAASSVVASAGSLKLGNKIYRSTFNSGQWTGDVLSQHISDEGEITSTPDWSASDALQAQVASGSREILSYNPDSRQGVPFRWPTSSTNPGDDELSLEQVESLQRNPITDNLDGQAEERLAYVRGDAVAGFRARESLLGDIIRSSPILVGPPSSRYSDDWGDGAPESNVPYSSFRDKHSERQRVVYAGANDGMLHAIDAGTFSGDAYTDGTGKELFAYVPSPVFPQLSDLTDPKYGHKYFVDSTPRASDVFINGEWRTVLIGGLGRGGQGIYALDVTEPNKISENTAEATVLWEFSDREDIGLGYTFHTPIIARMANGKWNAIIANGYNNSTRDVGYKRGGGWSSIIIIDIETGNLVKKMLSSTSCRGNQATPNAMAEPTAVDLDGDKIVDAVYAGDLYGCVYKFDVSNSNSKSWGKGTLKHRAVDDEGNAAPVTSAIAVGSHPTGEGVMLYFGTGKYLEPTDQLPSANAHRIYGIWDKSDNDNITSKTQIAGGQMLEQYITSEQTTTVDTDNDGADDTSWLIRLTSQEAIDWDSNQGWYMDLTFNSSRGEQVVAAPVLRDGKILITTHVPSGDECSPGQSGWLMALDARSGAMLNQSPLDFNGDGKSNDDEAAGVQNLVNPFAPPTLVAGEAVDYVLSQTDSGSEVTATGLAVSTNDGRLTWRELEP